MSSINNSIPTKQFIMNKLVVFFGLVVISSILASPLTEQSHRTLPAVEHEEIRDKFGQFAMRYVTAEGTVVSERGRLVPTPNGTDYVMIVEGEVSYIGDDGKIHVSQYNAGLDGNHAEVNHLPVAPEVPAATK